VIDVVAVPNRLEQAVGKPQQQDVLDGFFAEVMIDAVDLVLSQDLQKSTVQRPGYSTMGMSASSPSSLSCNHDNGFKPLPLAL
jgi:hypothetical protein